MTKPYSMAFKQKMVQRLTGKNAVSATQLAREMGIRQQNLSRWLEQARSLPVVAEQPKKPAGREWTVEQKARVLVRGFDEDRGIAHRDGLASFGERGGICDEVDDDGLGVEANVELCEGGCRAQRGNRHAD